MENELCSVSPIEELWDYLDDECWLLITVNDIAKKLTYYQDRDNEFYSPNQFTPTTTNPEDSYWMRNATFALFILAAEGELE